MPRGKSGKKEQQGDKEIQLDIQPEKDQVRSPSKLHQKLSINSQNFVMCRVGSFDQHYLITGKIGEGSFGTVYRVVHKTLKIERALKTIKKRSNQHFSSFEEIEVLKKLDHSNILKIYEFYQAPQSYYIITQIFDGKELFDVILDQDKLTERDAANILRQVLRAVNYTHSLKIAHRDIKPENILIRKNNDRYKVKIIDWGLGTLMGDHKANRICGTPQYCAPQVLKGDYSLSCDMWSIGAIAYVMMTGEMPFTGDNTQQTIKAVKKGVFNISVPSFKQLSQQAQKFIISLMNKNPIKRLNASGALQHPWIKKHSTNEGEPVCLRETLQRLKEFKLSSSLSTAVISFINNHLSLDSERQKLQEIFKHLDANSDGVLSLAQLITGYQKIYGKEMGRQIAEETFLKLDINHNGSLQFSQFVTFGLKQQKEQEQKRLREAFNLFDRDKNGKISKEEIALVIKGKVDANMESQIKQIISEIDQNGDEEIDVEEFVKSVEKIYQGKKEAKEITNNQQTIQSIIKQTPAKHKSDLKGLHSEKSKNKNKQEQTVSMIIQPSYTGRVLRSRTRSRCDM